MSTPRGRPMTPHGIVALAPIVQLAQSSVVKSEVAPFLMCIWIVGEDAIRPKEEIVFHRNALHQHHPVFRDF
jgi:hypothetical protein